MNNTNTVKPVSPPLNVEVVRTQFFPGCTIGALYIDGIFFCHTMEDTDRFLERKGIAAKIKNSTAIGAGKYRCVLSMSNRFKKVMPELLDVPGFEGIRIHSGNTSDDTEGCILVGSVIGKVDDKPAVLRSRETFNKLMMRLQRAGEITITVTRSDF